MCAGIIFAGRVNSGVQNCGKPDELRWLKVKIAFDYTTAISFGALGFGTLCFGKLGFWRIYLAIKSEAALIH